MTSPKAFEQNSGRQPAQPIHTPALHMLAQGLTFIAKLSQTTGY